MFEWIKVFFIRHYGYPFCDVIIVSHFLLMVKQIETIKCYSRHISSRRK
jgi:hypothetical protein